MFNLNSNQLFYPLSDWCDIEKRFLSIFLASKRQDLRFRTQEGEDVDTPTEQLTVDSLLTPSE